MPATGLLHFTQKEKTINQFLLFIALLYYEPQHPKKQ